MSAEFVTCKKCGGRREHDLRTGEVGPCDTCEGSLLAAKCPCCGHEFSVEVPVGTRG